MGNTRSRDQKRIEGFDPLRPNPNPLGGHEADICLNIAERIDGYRTAVDTSTMNRKARTGQVYAAEINLVGLEIKESPKPWWSGQVLWLNGSADGGLPHTRPPGYICLPSTINKASLDKTLLHERVHLSQRRYVKEWNAFFEKEWKMKVWSGSLPEKLEESRRLNPDLMQVPFYIWRDKWVTYGAFNDTQNPTLQNASTVWYDIETKVTSKMPPTGWTDFFGPLISDEHPWETSAYLVTDKNNSPAYKALEAFVKTLPSTYISTT
jgi:hypothetical protein